MGLFSFLRTDLHTLFAEMPLITYPTSPLSEVIRITLVGRHIRFVSNVSNVSLQIGSTDMHFLGIVGIIY